MTVAPLAFTAGPEQPAPRVPDTLDESGLGREFIVELLLKTIHVHGPRSGRALAESICLPFAVIDELLHELQQRRVIEVCNGEGHSRSAYEYDLAPVGRERAREALLASQYVGPAPVPVDQYSHWVRAHSISYERITRDRVREGLQSLVLEPGMLDALGPAINSGAAMFLYGDPGNGKTAIAKAIARMMGGSVFVPHAVKIGGQVMLVYDPVYHRALDAPPEGAKDTPWLRPAESYDRRYVRIARPIVEVGGELMLEQLDLQYDPYTKLYQAPFQVRANGGVLIIDDFGRQRVPPRELLNRWIVPLERREDVLTLHTGSKFPVPFDSLLIFATNLDPGALVEEAFLRRIRYKIHVASPDRVRYTEIFRRCCDQINMEFDPAAVRFVYDHYYDASAIEPRACHPRDLLGHVCDTARFRETAASLSPELLEAACHWYFLELAPNA